MTFKQSFKEVSTDRSFVIVGLVGLLLVASTIVLGLVNIRPSDFQLPSHYSAYGVTNIYRDKWFYALNFIVFTVVVLIINSLISLKLFSAKGRRTALVCMWLTILLLLISVVTVAAILQLNSFGR